MTTNYRATAAIIAATACWGFGAVLTKIVLERVLPLPLLVVQLVASVALLWSIVAVQRLSVPLGRETLFLGASGLINPGLAYTFTLLALASTTASAAALIWAVQPIIVIVLAWLLLNERVSGSLIGCSLVAVVGVVLVAGAGGNAGSVTGTAFAVAGALCVAVYVVLTRHISANVAPLALAAIQQTAALLWAIAVLILSGQDMPTSADGWTLALCSGIVYYALAFWLYIIGLKQMPANLASLFLNLTTIFSVGGAYVLLGERLNGTQWLGATLIVGAMIAFFWVQLKYRDIYHYSP